jgi:hypothetical protein
VVSPEQAAAFFQQFGLPCDDGPQALDFVDDKSGD